MKTIIIIIILIGLGVALYFIFANNSSEKQEQPEEQIQEESSGANGFPLLLPGETIGLCVNECKKKFCETSGGGSNCDFAALSECTAKCN